MSDELLNCPAGACSQGSTWSAVGANARGWLCTPAGQGALRQKVKKELSVKPGGTFFFALFLTAKCFNLHP